MLFIRDSAIQKCSRRLCTVCKSEKSGSLSVVRTTCHPVQTPSCPKHQPSEGRVKPSGLTSNQSIIGLDEVDSRPDIPLCQEASNCSSLHPSGRLSVFDQALGFLSKHRYGKIAATVQTTWIPVRTREHQIWKLRASEQQYGRPSSWSGRAKPLYGNYLQRTCDRSYDSAPPSGHSSQTGKIFSEIVMPQI
jgi:hypothetical protein